MTKLSEILEQAMPAYIEKISRRAEIPNLGDLEIYGNMCIRIAQLVNLTDEASYEAQNQIKLKLEGHVFLKDYLNYKGRKTTALAQIRFYRQWIKELKAKGE